MSGDGPFLSVENLFFHYEKRAVIDGLSFAVAAGEFFAVLGASGAGKTTLLRLLSGVLRPSAGRILLRGEDVTRRPARLRALSMVFQNYSLFPHLTTGGNLGFPLRICGVTGPTRASRVRAAAAGMGMGLAGRLGALPEKLSMGQKQRTALGRATIRGRDLLLLDEPLSEVDGPERFRLRREFRTAVREGGATIIYVTNNREEVAALADRVLVLAEGRALALGPPHELLERPPSPAVADALAPWPLATSPARVFRDRLELADGSLVMIGDAGTALPATCLAAFRVEGWKRAGAASGFYIEGRVALTERLSPDRALVHLERPTGWRYLENGADPPRIGDRIRLEPNPGGLLLFSEDGSSLLRSLP